MKNLAELMLKKLLLKRAQEILEMKRKDFKGPNPAGKAMGGRVNFRGGGICKKGMNKNILRK